MPASSTIVLSSNANIERLAATLVSEGGADAGMADFLTCCLCIPHPSLHQETIGALGARCGGLAIPSHKIQLSDDFMSNLSQVLAPTWHEEQ